VAIVGVTPPDRDQADQMQPPVRPRRAATSLDERGPGGEAAVGDRGVDPRQVLQHGAPGSEVEVANLGVAHLPGRQPDRVLGGAERGMRPVAQEPSPDRHVRRGDGVGRRIGTDPEAVEDDQDDGRRASRRSITSSAGRRRAGRAGMRPSSGGRRLDEAVDRNSP
jgi:hypothetical protein